MGTNYFYVNPCHHCGHAEEVHIGKSSGGWCFALQYLPEKGLIDWPQWKFYLEEMLKQKPDSYIKDEYDRVVTLHELEKTVTDRNRKEPCQWTEEMYEKNYAEPGPNNLVRHQINQWCVSHGSGTWDMMQGWFR